MKYKNRFDNKLKNNEMVNFEDFYLWTIEEKAKAYDELIEYLKEQIKEYKKELSYRYQEDHEIGLAKGYFNAYEDILSKIEKR